MKKFIAGMLIIGMLMGNMPVNLFASEILTDTDATAKQENLSEENSDEDTAGGADDQEAAATWENPENSDSESSGTEGTGAGLEDESQAADQTGMESESGSEGQTGTESESGDADQTGTESESVDAGQTGTESGSGDAGQTGTESESGDADQTGTESGSVDAGQTGIELESGTEEAESEEAQAADADRLIIEKTIDLTLKYDDYHEIEGLPDDYVLAYTENTRIDSYKVSGGSVTSDKDEDIVQPQDEGAGHQLRATGVGTATLYYTKAEDVSKVEELIKAGEMSATDKTAENAERPTTDETAESGETSETGETPETGEKEETDETPESGEKAETDETAESVSIECYQVNVTVKTADLSLMFLLGQSNMVGMCTLAVYHPQDSVLCEEGQVYSTFYPRSTLVGKNVAGVRYEQSSTYENISYFTAESLTSTVSLDGNTLEYQLNALTSSGKGKTGPDAGLAYEWNRLTGQKVWVVNAGCSGSTAAQWVPGGICYQQMVAAYEAVRKVLKAETAAGHFRLVNKLAFWLQGGSDKNGNAAAYADNLIALYKGLDQLMNFRCFGIILTRTGLGDRLDAKEVYLNAPRAVQYTLPASGKCPKMRIVSNLNEKWITDSGVKNYFQNKYPGGVPTYPMRSTSTITANLKTVKEIHADLHYSQAGHNENGIDAADGMYAVLYGKQSVKKAYWVDYYNHKTTGITVEQYSCATLVLKTDPISSLTGVTFSCSNAKIKYNSKTGTVNVLTQKAGTYRLTARDSNGKKLSTVKITVKVVLPKVKAVNSAKGVIVSWTSRTDAEKYYIYRKTPGGKWKKIGEGTGNTGTYTDTTVKNKSGKVYRYAVRAVYKLGLGSYARTSCIKRLANPKFTLKNVSSGIRIGWKAVTGAEKYIIYRKTSGGKWKRIARINQLEDKKINIYYDTSVVNRNGRLYYYTVKAVGSYKKTLQTSRYYANKRITRVKESEQKTIIKGFNWIITQKRRALTD